MGRQQYLERLVYGRSAFEELRTEDLTQFLERTADENDETAQQYDAKGRPTNPRSEQFDTELRHAQNEVLALVGAIERRNEAEAERAEHRANARRDILEHALESEHEYGGQLLIWADLCNCTILWCSDVLLARVLAGTHPPRTGYWQVLAVELAQARGIAWYASMLRLAQGLTIMQARISLENLCMLLISPVVGRVLTHIGTRADHSRRRATQTATMMLNIVLRSVLDLLLLPVATYGCAVVLGLAPINFLQPLPEMHTLALYTHHVYDTSFASFTQAFASPLIPFLCLDMFNRSGSASAEELWSKHVVAAEHRKPSFALHGSSALARHLISLLRLRSAAEIKALHWVGWRPLTSTTVSMSTDHFQRLTIHARNSCTDDKDDRTSRHRVTRLALLPITWLGLQLGATLNKLLMLPLEALFLQRSAAMYVKSGLPLSAAARHSTSEPRGLSSYCSYFSAVGLGMVTRVIVQGAVFGMLWAVVRWQGVRSYGWMATNSEQAIVETTVQSVTSIHEQSVGESIAWSGELMSGEEAVLGDQDISDDA
ncbi:hypothetical protein LTR95_008219 [Oleoguttula sp. CCFEE 5521]